jgi:hypothetical protein
MLGEASNHLLLLENELFHAKAAGNYPLDLTRNSWNHIAPAGAQGDKEDEVDDGDDDDGKRSCLIVRCGSTMARFTKEAKPYFEDVNNASFIGNAADLYHEDAFKRALAASPHRFSTPSKYWARDIRSVLSVVFVYVLMGETYRKDSRAGVAGILRWELVKLLRPFGRLRHDPETDAEQRQWSFPDRISPIRRPGDTTASLATLIRHQKMRTHQVSIQRVLDSLQNMPYALVGGETKLLHPDVHANLVRLAEILTDRAAALESPSSTAADVKKKNADDDAASDMSISEPEEEEEEPFEFQVNLYESAPASEVRRPRYGWRYDNQDDEDWAIRVEADKERAALAANASDEVRSILLLRPGMSVVVIEACPAARFCGIAFCLL